MSITCALIAGCRLEQLQILAQAFIKLGMQHTCHAEPTSIMDWGHRLNSRGTLQQEILPLQGLRLLLLCLHLGAAVGTKSLRLKDSCGRNMSTVRS